MRRIYYIFLFFLIPLESRSQHWEGVGGGTDLTYWTVHGLYSTDSLLHVCGGFDSIAGGTIESLAYGLWDGNNWYPSNITFFNGGPRCFLAYNDIFYMAGTFKRINGNKYCQKISQKDSSGSWLPLGSGVTDGSIVNCMAVYNGDLFIGGQFTEVDSTIVARRIARWDGTSWHAMGSGIQGGFGEVRCMAVFQNELYVGGDFSSIDGLPARFICRWNGTSWDSVDTGVYGLVFSMYVDSINNRLYVGGIFGQAGNTPTPSGVAYWDGNSWHAVGTEPFVPARSLFKFNGILYNGTTQSGITNSLGDTINNICWLDGNIWREMGGGVTSSPHAFAEYQGQMYVGGGFQYAGDSLVYGIAKWIPGSLGIHESTEETFTMKLTPNPARDEVILEIVHSNYTGLKLKVTDSGGKPVYTESLASNDKHIINASGLSSGIYIFSVYHNEKLVAGEKVVITK